MISVTVRVRPNQEIIGFTVKGHANYAESGKDIVCAAVSAITYTTIAGLLNLAGGCDYQEESGFMAYTRTPSSNPKEDEAASIILQTAFIGYQQIAHQYISFVKVLEKEVKES